jgi:2-deoxy-D-gluconate 3-dehydrogenase
MKGIEAFSLKGKVALVTGSGKGLGRAIAVGMAEAGADIVGHYAHDAGDTGRLVAAAGRRFAPLKADLTKPERAQEVLAQAWEAFGQIDILVNNAGIIRRASALDFTQEDWDDVMNVNLKSIFFLSQAAAQRWVALERGGKIINIASMMSFQGGIRIGAYTASKSGLAGITRLLANEWAARGICVNAIAPGYFLTDNTAAIHADPERNRSISERIPAGRWGAPEELAGAAVFLASSASDYVHGFTLAVDGGWLAR